MTNLGDRLQPPRKASLKDVTALKGLAARAYQHYVPIIGAVPVPMSADYARHVRDDDVWVVASGGRLAGSLVLIRQPNHLLIESISVDPDFQGQGLGNRLLEFARLQAGTAEYPSIRLYTHVLMTENRAWYRRAGFEETGEEQRGDKRIVHMRLDLPPEMTGQPVAQ